LLIASSSAIAQQSEWKAGIAKIAITPEQPVWMAGYASRSRPSEGKVHDLTTWKVIVGEVFALGYSNLSRLLRAWLGTKFVQTETSATWKGCCTFVVLL
jgi:hypothetical protein